jgi:hypothetical protein
MKFNLPFLKPTFTPTAVEERDHDVETSTPQTDSKEIRVIEDSPSVSEAEKDAVDKTAQVGVQKIEATTSAWSRNQLILAYALYVPLMHRYSPGVTLML